MKRNFLKLKNVKHLKNQNMKFLLFITLLTLLSLSSCKKHKEKKAWEDYQGVYYPVNNTYQLHHDTLEQREITIESIHISIEGILFKPTVNGQPTASFKLAVDNNSSYGYQIRYLKLLLLVITNSNGNMTLENIQYPSEEEFADERTFFITKKSNNLTLTVVKNDGITNYLFSK